MFQFSNLLNRTQTGSARGRRPSSSDCDAVLDDYDQPSTFGDSHAQRVRRELDEQMERLTKLLEHVESREFGQEASQSDPAIDGRDHSDTPALPHIFRGDEVPVNDAIDPNFPNHDSPDEPALARQELPETSAITDIPLPQLESAVFDLATEVVPDLLFDASSADHTNQLTSASNSIDTDDVVPPPSLAAILPFERAHAKAMLTVYRPNRVADYEFDNRGALTREPTYTEAASGSTERRDIPAQVQKCVASGQAERAPQPDLVPIVRIRRPRRVPKSRRKRPSILTAPVHAPKPRGVVQDFSAPPRPIPDESPTLEILESDLDADKIANRSDVEPPTAEKANRAELNLFGSSDVQPHHWEPAISLDIQPAHALVDSSTRNPSVILIDPRPSDALPQYEIEDGSNWVSDSAIPAADDPKDPAAMPPIAPATESTRSSDEHGASAGSLKLTLPHNAGAGLGSPGTRQLENPRFRVALAGTERVTPPATGSRFLNVLAVIGAILTLLTLALVGTDFASWF